MTGQSDLLPELTMVQMLQRRAEQTPNGTALRQKDYGIWQPISWHSYWARARDVAAGLLKLGCPTAGTSAFSARTGASG